MPKTVVQDAELGAVTDDPLTRDVRVFQREKGHRFSADDIATAYVAFHAAPTARRVADLGCGLGSVLLHLAWSMPEATLVGVEAQEISFALLRRNVARNGLGARVAIHHGDLRDEALLAQVGRGFDLVTGTPPYFPPGAAVDAADPQRAYARIEYRGGVEAYLAAGSVLLSEAGTMVLCGDAKAGERVARGATAAGLHVNARCDIVPRAGRAPLFAIWTLARAEAALARSALTLRDVDGERTPDAHTLRMFSGLGPAR